MSISSDFLELLGASKSFFVKMYKPNLECLLTGVLMDIWSAFTKWCRIIVMTISLVFIQNSFSQWKPDQWQLSTALSVSWKLSSSVSYPV